MSEDIIKVIPIHYEVESHSIDLDVFIKAAQGVETIASNIGNILCGEKIRCKVLILPPEEGSFKQMLGIAIAGVVSFVGTEITSGVVKGLTGKSIEDWAENGAECIKECVISYMKNDEASLVQKLPSDADLSKSKKAKSDFYIACENSKGITAIGFSESDDFPIKRDTFMSYASETPKISEPPTIYKLHKLTIAAPVIIDGSNTKWKFKINGYGDKIFNINMNDDEFFKGVLSGKYPLKETSEDDTIDAYVSYSCRTGTFNYNELSIIKVYRINKMTLAKIPSGVEFDVKSQNEDPAQLDLFADNSNEN